MNSLNFFEESRIIQRKTLGSKPLEVSGYQLLKPSALQELAVEVYPYLQKFISSNHCLSTQLKRASCHWRMVSSGGDSSAFAKMERSLLCLSVFGSPRWLRLFFNQYENQLTSFTKDCLTYWKFNPWKFCFFKITGVSGIHQVRIKRMGSVLEEVLYSPSVRFVAEAGEPSILFSVLVPMRHHPLMSFGLVGYSRSLELEDIDYLAGHLCGKQVMNHGMEQAIHANAFKFFPLSLEGARKKLQKNDEKIGYYIGRIKIKTREQIKRIESFLKQNGWHSRRFGAMVLLSRVEGGVCCSISIQKQKKKLILQTMTEHSFLRTAEVFRFLFGQRMELTERFSIEAHRYLLKLGVKIKRSDYGAALPTRLDKEPGFTTQLKKAIRYLVECEECGIDISNKDFKKQTGLDADFIPIVQGAINRSRLKLVDEDEK